MAWVKYPLPFIPPSRDVIGMNDIDITSGW
jgi:hypothetical protein